MDKPIPEAVQSPVKSVRDAAQYLIRYPGDDYAQRHLLERIDQLEARLTAAQQQGSGDLGEVVCLACGDPIMPMGQVCHACSHPVSAPPSAPVGVVEALSELVDLMQGVIDGEYKPDSFTLQPARAALAQQPSVAPVGVEGLPGLPCGVAVVTAKPGCGGTTAHVRIPQDAGTQLYSPQQVRDLMQQAAALAQQPAAVDGATRLLRAYRLAPKFSNDHNAIKQTCALEDEIDLFLATQHQEPTT
jgi:hypothetical protein